MFGQKGTAIEHSRCSRHQALTKRHGEVNSDADVAGQQNETVQRFVTAHDKTKEVLESGPVERELHAGTEIASD